MWKTVPSEDSKYGLLENATCKTNWLETLYEYTLTCYVFVMYLFTGEKFRKQPIREILKEWVLLGLERVKDDRKESQQRKKKIFFMLSKGAFQPCLAWLQVLTD